ncbi:16S rRNA (uracil(1498)-N(3))-methyltransferase [Microbacterium allomyrinae]|uniref:Ribosomal RNA small subunit methyltransferase E n=1 Tax=Microbacterium allomyrinae TaxID=2830666 RepID=A0A9X1LV38_9MICO|nr:16S rRNA (uracil(1498)-N(3))-methyltransferase [Microbacterium allomyrinae]MCC2032241.1 16S rRNA (uracil(1498)-N(3))-methyltransferase [Microbacterium allomyrinae]
MPLHFLLDGAGAGAGAEVSDAGPGDPVTLTGAEAHHAAAVRRVRTGEQVTIGDGRGTWLSGEVESVAPREVIVRISSRADVPAPTRRLVLVQALAKGDRDELAVQAATELGVDEIVPWQAARSVSRWDAAKAQKGRDRWAGIVREAAKQAHRAWVPEVGALATTAQLSALAASAVVLVLEPNAEEALTSLALDDREDDVVMVVGPEGGIASDELDALARGGAQLVRLGDTVLRTSTAGPAALAVVSAAIGRW